MNRSAVRVILGAELRAWWNRLTRARAGRNAVVAVLLLAAVVIFGGFVFSGGMAAAQYLPEQSDAMLAGAFTALTVLMLVLGFPTVISNFFVGADLLQLVVAPVRTVDIFTARALLAARANLLLGCVILAFLAGIGVGSRASPIFYPAAVALLFIAVIGVTALQVVLMAIVLRFVPSRIARDVAVAVAGLAGAGLYLAWNVTLRGSLIRRGTPDVSGLVTLANRIDWLPSAWPGHALSAVVRGDVGAALGWSAVFLALTLGLTSASAALYGRTLLAGLGLLGGTPTLWKRRARTAQVTRAEAIRSSSPAMAIARKDWLAYRRDIRRLSRLLPGIFFLFAYAFVLVRPTVGAGRFWTDVFLTAFISMFLAMAVATSAVPGERRGFQLLRMAPIDSWEILRAKVLYTLSPVISLAVLISAVVATAAGNAPVQVLQIALLAVWLGFGFVAVGVSAGAIDPRFDSVDDRRAVGVAGTFAALGGELAFGALSVGAFALAQFAVDVPSFLPQSPVTVVALAGLAVVFTAGAVGLVALMLWLAARRLRSFEGAISTAA